MRSIVREAENSQNLADSSGLLERAENFYGQVLRLAHAGVLVHAVPRTVREMLLCLMEHVENVHTPTSVPGSVQLPVVSLSRGQRGRPRFLVLEDTLLYLLENRFSVNSIAGMLCVSQSTIRRRMRECGLYVSEMYSDIADDELDAQVLAVKESFPNAGSRMLQGHLLSTGLRVQQHRIRDSLRRVDPEGCALRWFEGIHRRKYSVPHSQALWHIDSNHKLIR